MRAISVTPLLTRSPGLVLFLFALLLRLLFVAITVDTAPTFKFTDDSQRYDRLALNLVHRGEFRAAAFQLAELNLPPDYEGREVPAGYLTGSRFPDATHFDGPDVKRVPLFALFLGIVYFVFGYNPTVFLVVQAFVSAMSCWFLYRLGRSLGQPLVGLIAAFLLAVNPRTILYVAKIQVEPFFVWTLLVTVLSMLAYLRKPTWRATIFFALALGWSTATREMGMYLVVLFAPAILYPVFRRRIHEHQRTAKCATIFLVSISVIAGWCARNHHHYGKFIWTTHTSFTEAWDFAPRIMAGVWNVSEEQARLRMCEEFVEQYPEYQSDLDRLRESPLAFWSFNQRVDMNLRAAAFARPYYLDHPGSTARAFAAGAFWSMWAGFGEWRGLLMSEEDYKELEVTAGTQEAKKALFRLELRKAGSIVVDLLSKIPLLLVALFGYVWALMVALYASTVVGVVPLWRTNPVVTLECLLLIGFAGLVVGPAGANRLFVIAYPFISLLSAAGLIASATWWRRRRNGHGRAVAQRLPS